MLLPVVRYRFCAEVQKPLELPFYAGSMLRGAFGQALRRLACVERRSECADCSLTAVCLYTALFEAAKAPRAQNKPVNPNPYVIEPPPVGHQVLSVGQHLEFSMVLIGNAIPHLPLIILAWQQALQHGLAKGKSRCQLQSVYSEHDSKPIFTQGRGYSPPDIPKLPAINNTQALSLVFQTPLRLQHQSGRVGLRELTAPVLLIALLRRIQALCQEHLTDDVCPELSHLFQHLNQVQVTDTQGLHWVDWTRYSSRQQQNMTLGGLMGEVRLEGNLEPFIPLLYLGQWLHLGKNTTFGMGQYIIHNPEESA